MLPVILVPDDDDKVHKMTETDGYKVMKNEESGAEVYQCTVCSAKYGTKKAIKTHVTTKHKPKKKNEETTVEKSDDKNENEDTVLELEESTGDFVRSTQIAKPLAVEDIYEFYEEGRSEYLDGSDNDTAKKQAGAVIPDDTMDQIMKDVDVDEQSSNN